RQEAGLLQQRGEKRAAWFQLWSALGGGAATLEVHRVPANFDEIVMEQSLLFSESLEAISSSSFSLSD
nr:hypothetical protein [Tanacetum cinerariifolium]